MPEARRQMDSHLDKLIDGAGPKKLLSIDGGGIRGLIAIEFLSRIEAILRDRSGRSDLVLGDYFDYVGGTSTGAIVATLISMGFATKEIREFYVTGAHTMFDPSNVFLRLERKVSPNSIWAKLLNSIGMLTSSAMYTQKAL